MSYNSVCHSVSTVEACLDCLKHALVDKQLPFITSDTRHGPACEEGRVVLENVNNPRADEEKPIPLTLYIINLSGMFRENREEISTTLHTWVYRNVSFQLTFLPIRFQEVFFFLFFAYYVN